MKKNFKLFILLFVALVVVSNCTKAPITNRTQLKIVDEEKTVLEGKKAYRDYINDMAAEKLLLNNTSDGIRLRKIGNKITTAVEKYMNENGMSEKIKDLEWEINLVKSDQVNAWAIAGGKIAFYSGIMPVLKTDAGIAFVMGHEIGHVIGGHHAEGASQRQLGNILIIGKNVADILTNGAISGTIGSQTLEKGVVLGLQKFSRTNEYEADRYGMIFMAMAGYDPSESIAVWERMTEKSGNRTFTLLDSHPGDEDRIKRMKQNLPEAMKYYKPN